MGSFSLVHWAIVLLSLAVFCYPLARIVGRTGLSPFWALLIFVPLGNLIGLWALAFVRWPALPRTADPASS